MNGLVLLLGVIVLMLVVLAAVRVVDIWLSRRAPSKQTQQTRESLARAVARSAQGEPRAAPSDPAPLTRVVSRGRPALLPFGAVLVVATAVIAAVIAWVLAPQRHMTRTDGEVQVFQRLPQDHVEGTVSYHPDPPVGGPHSAVWQNCGFYSEPVAREAAVHSLEHGAVWVTYRPDLPEARVEALRQTFAADTFVLVSPFPGLDRPVIASAWRHQLSLRSTTDPRLQEFVDTFQQGPQRPEAGGPCTGGAGGPEAP